MDTFMDAKMVSDEVVMVLSETRVVKKDEFGIHYIYEAKNNQRLDLVSVCNISWLNNRFIIVREGVDEPTYMLVDEKMDIIINNAKFIAITHNNKFLVLDHNDCMIMYDSKFDEISREESIMAIINSDNARFIIQKKIETGLEYSILHNFSDDRQIIDFKGTDVLTQGDIINVGHLLIIKNTVYYINLGYDKLYEGEDNISVLYSFLSDKMDIILLSDGSYSILVTDGEVTNLSRLDLLKI